MIFSLCQVTEKVCEKKRELYMVFVDLTEAFATVNRNALWTVLKKLGIPDNMLNVIISFHEGMKAAVLSDSEFSSLLMCPAIRSIVVSWHWFSLLTFFSVMLHHAFSECDASVKFQFRTSGGLFNHQQFQAKTH